jgi:glycosyltransferase involved in cell wall biosynthesis
MAAHLKSTINTLCAQGAQVVVVASDEPEMDMLKGLPRVRCVPIDIPRNIAPWRDIKALISLYLFFRREQIQIAHSTTPKAGLLTALAAFLARVPIRLHTFTGQPWVTMHGPKRWLARWSDQVIGKLNTRCYADSLSQRQFLISKNIVNGNRLLVLGDGSLAGVDTLRFNRDRFTTENCIALKRSHGIPDGAPILLFVGRINPDKGVNELLQAFSKIKSAGSTAHLVFVGRLDVESGASGLISEGDVARIPDAHLVAYSEVPESYFSIADILCLPSYREGFGTVVIEAAAMGVPTVGTNIYGLSDAVEQGETGLLISPRNVGELEEALLVLLNDKLLRHKLGVAAKQRALALFDSVRVNSLIVDEYHALLRAAGINQ